MTFSLFLFVCALRFKYHARPLRERERERVCERFSGRFFCLCSSETLNKKTNEVGEEKRTQQRSLSVSLFLSSRKKKMAPPPSSSGGSPFAGRGGANKSDALFVRLAETEGSFVCVLCLILKKHFFP